MQRLEAKGRVATEEAHVPCSHTAPGIALASLVIGNAWAPKPTDLQVRHIHHIVECYSELECLMLDSQRLGSDEAPLTFTTRYIQLRSVPLSINIWTAKGCWLRLNKAIHPHKNLALNIEGPLHMA